MVSNFNQCAFVCMKLKRFFFSLIIMHLMCDLMCFVARFGCLYLLCDIEQGSKDQNSQNKVEDKLFKDDELVNLIDPILNMDDLNKDGYIDYPEFVRAQQKAAAGGGQQAPNH